MAIKVFGDKIVFPDDTRQVSAGVEEAPENGNQYARQDGVWSEVKAEDGGLPDAPNDGKTYGRKDLAWSEVKDSGYTDIEIDAQQESQDTKIDQNTLDIEQNTSAISSNTVEIEKNTTDIVDLADEVSSLTGAVVYKGSINATTSTAPSVSNTGDMYINNYNSEEPATVYPITGWGSVTNIKFDDKLIKTDTDWDRIEGAVGTSSYTKGETDVLLDEKANVGDSYLKSEANDLIEVKADKINTYTRLETDALLEDKVDEDAVYTKEQIDAQQKVQDDLIVDNKNAIAALPSDDDFYDKNDIDILQNAQDVRIQANADAISTLPNEDDFYNKGQIDIQQGLQDDKIEALQEGIFFSSAYSANYPVSANRNPENGNMYLQQTGIFTYNYADCNQVFLSKTDEQGNTREFTAIQPGDSLVLNEVNSANYGRYELVSVDDAVDYVVLVVNNKEAQGSVLAGAKVAFQAFPASGGGTGDAYTKAESDAIDDAQDVNISANTTAIATKINEAPIDGKEYVRKDATWVEVTGVKTVAFRGELSANQTVTNAVYTKVNLNTASIDTDNSFFNGTFRPSVAGYYQVNGSIAQACSPVSNRTIAGIFKNGSLVTGGNSTASPDKAYSSSVNDLIYLNGTSDNIFLVGYVDGTGTRAIDNNSVYTFLSAVLVSGVN